MPLLTRILFSPFCRTNIFGIRAVLTPSSSLTVFDSWSTSSRRDKRRYLVKLRWRMAHMLASLKLILYLTCHCTTPHIDSLLVFVHRTVSCDRRSSVRVSRYSHMFDKGTTKDVDIMSHIDWRCIAIASDKAWVMDCTGYLIWSLNCVLTNRGGICLLYPFRKPRYPDFHSSS